MAWYNESGRHAKAAKGNKTGRKDRSHPKLAFRGRKELAAESLTEGQTHELKHRKIWGVTSPEAWHNVWTRAEAAGIQGWDLGIFTSFITLAFPHAAYDEPYLDEWIQRYKTGHVETYIAGATPRAAYKEALALYEIPKKKKSKLEGINVGTVGSQGALEVSAMKDGYRVHKTYIGYSKREAIRLFKREMK